MGGEGGRQKRPRPLVAGMSCLYYKKTSYLDMPWGIDQDGRVRNRLRVLRAEREISQAQLAELLGVSRQTVNAIETGKYDPSLPLAFAIARCFAQRIEEVFLPEDLPTQETP